jgi:hypothetical protein
MENQTDEQTNQVIKEQEIVIYAKMGNPEGLSQAIEVEEHEQFVVKTEQVLSQNKGQVRVRKISKKGSIKFEMTTKLKLFGDGLQSNQEITTDITEEYFNVFKQIATSSMHKTRYKFNLNSISVKIDNTTKTLDVPDVFYEVDVFKTKDGTMCEWVKIDLEVQTILEEISKLYPGSQVKFKVKIAKIPFDPKDNFTSETATQEQHALLSGLYENVFVKKL